MAKATKRRTSTVTALTKTVVTFNEDTALPFAVEGVGQDFLLVARNRGSGRTVRGRFQESGTYVIESYDTSSSIPKGDRIVFLAPQ
jgi:hypothetical protein